MGTLYLVRHGQASFGAADYDNLSELGLHTVVTAHTVQPGQPLCREWAQEAHRHEVEPQYRLLLLLGEPLTLRLLIASVAILGGIALVIARRTV